EPADVAGRDRPLRALHNPVLRVRLPGAGTRPHPATPSADHDQVIARAGQRAPRRSDPARMMLIAGIRRPARVSSGRRRRALLSLSQEMRGAMIIEHPTVHVRSLADLIAAFLSDLAQRNRSAHTRRAYAADLARFASFYVGTVEGITAEVLRAFF